MELTSQVDQWLLYLVMTGCVAAGSQSMSVHGSEEKSPVAAGYETLAIQPTGN
jgi:hypothetical protein